MRESDRPSCQRMISRRAAETDEPTKEQREEKDKDGREGDGGEMIRDVETVMNTEERKQASRQKMKTERRDEGRQ